jgi:hypothetical protein
MIPAHWGIPFPDHFDDKVVNHSAINLMIAIITMSPIVGRAFLIDLSLHNESI